MQGIGYGRKIFSADILEEGKPAIERLGTYLERIEADYYVRSKIKRCKQTAEIVSRITGKEFIGDGRLNEYFIETFGYFKGRIQRFLKDLDEKGYDSVVICTHGAVISGLRKLILEEAFKPADLGLYPDPGVLIVIDQGKYQEISFN